MTVFRNVMAFLGLDEDDEVYDDEEFYDDEPLDERRPARSSTGRTIPLDERLTDQRNDFAQAIASDRHDRHEPGGVGTIRPLRPLPVEDPAAGDPPANGVVDEQSGAALRERTVVSDRRRNAPSDAGAFEDGGGFEDAPGPLDEGYASGAAPLELAEQEPIGVDGAGAVPGDRPSGHTVHDGLQNSGALPSQPPPASTSARSSRRQEEPMTPVVSYAKPRLHIPASFDEASRVADDFAAGAPVVMNLKRIDKPVARRLIDFASGVCYVSQGKMERLAGGVYLLTPKGIDVSSEDRRRMQERGFDR